MACPCDACDENAPFQNPIALYTGPEWSFCKSSSTFVQPNGLVTYYLPSVLAPKPLFEVTSAQSVSQNGGLYRLKEFHFHLSSEHTLNDQTFPCESHFVNKTDDGHFCVLSFFFELGDVSDPMITSALSHVPFPVPDLNEHFAFPGSFTGNQFQKTIQWLISTHVRKISPNDLNELKLRQFAQSARRLQPRNLRMVVLNQ